MVFRVLALLVCAVLVWYGLHKYHQRRGLELEQRHAKHHGWERVTLTVRHDVWACPLCGALMASWQDVQVHRFNLTSPCAEHQDKLAAAAAEDEVTAAARAAQDAGRWSASAVAGGEQHSGAVDTWKVEPEPRGELESGDSDG